MTMGAVMRPCARSTVRLNNFDSMRELVMTVASQGCRYFISRGSRVVRSPFLHGVLIGSAIAGLVLLAL
jgi:hypothetical protein